jgi:hypothetical protein
MKRLLQIISIVASLGFLSVSAQNAPASAEAKKASADAKKAAADSLPDKNASKDTILKAIETLTQKNPVFAVEIVTAAFEKYGNSLKTSDIISAAKIGLNAATTGNVNTTGVITSDSKNIVLQNLDATVGANGVPVAAAVSINNRLPLVVNPSASTLPSTTFEKLITNPSASEKLIFVPSVDPIVDPTRQ